MSDPVDAESGITAQYARCRYARHHRRGKRMGFLDCLRGIVVVSLNVDPSISLCGGEICSV